MKRIAPIFVFLICFAQCSSRVQEVPFPQGKSFEIPESAAQSAFYAQYAHHFSHEPISSYRFLARAQYREADSRKSAKQVFVFVPPNSLRVDEYSSIGNQLLLKIVIHEDRAWVEDVFQHTREEFSNIEQFIEYFFGEEFSIDELFTLFFGRCLYLHHGQGKLMEGPKQYIVQSTHEGMHVSCVFDKSADRVSWYFGEDDLVNIQVDWEAFQEQNGYRLPTRIHILSPKTGRRAEFSLEHIGVNKSVSETFFTPSQTRSANED